MFINKTQLNIAVDFIAEHNKLLRDNIARKGFTTEHSIKNYVRTTILKLVKDLVKRSGPGLEESVISWKETIGVRVVLNSEENRINILINPAVSQEGNWVNLTELGVNQMIFDSSK